MCVSLDVDLNPVYIRSEDSILADSLSRVMYCKTRSKLPDLLVCDNICCKDELLGFFRNFDGATHQEEEASDEKVGGQVYMEE